MSRDTTHALTPELVALLNPRHANAAAIEFVFKSKMLGDIERAAREATPTHAMFVYVSAVVIEAIRAMEARYGGKKSDGIGAAENEADAAYLAARDCAQGRTP